ncbi:hypothetical protein PR202_ga20409 [Eleusine coracana subsp. coracana]|uniref:RRM domain-containing protein n=1 Tax=Eleusine coracana subsp. coracana TaxID=191504 RepID=A0AAV5CYK5_ELECO|nr:hypothetical protein PR202_ga20409 [Eleusine coracana subsp. coracana]
MAMAALREASCRLGLASSPFCLFSGLSQFATEDSLAEAFSQYGQVLEDGASFFFKKNISATIVTDKMTSRPKGFGLLKFALEEDANKAREEMNGKARFFFLM